MSQPSLITSIHLGPHRDGDEFTTELANRRLRVVRLGAGGDQERAAHLVTTWKGRTDVLGISAPPRIAERLRAHAEGTPVVTGATLRSFSDEWTIRQLQVDEKGLVTNARVLVLSGGDDRVVARALADHTRNISFADPVLRLGVPKILTSAAALDLFLRGAGPVRAWEPQGPLVERALRARFCSHVLRRAMHKATVVVGPYDALAAFGLEELGGKTVITAGISDEENAFLRDAGVDVVIDLVPHLLDRPASADVVEAAILLSRGRRPEEANFDDFLAVIERSGVRPRVVNPAGTQHRMRRFAFVIHPLSREYFKTVKAVDRLSRATPRAFMSALERVIAHSPPFLYSRVTGIKSPTGDEAEGWLISVGGTPKQLLSHSPEFTYRRLLAAARMAERLGAQIMGLGAFTKVVGDAGVTVARRARIPITTGNSYSASGALWAAHDAVRRMGLVPRRADGRFAGKAMVVGATGAIGSVCARLLAMVAEELILVSPEIAKLLALKASIESETPGARIHTHSRPDEHLGEMDMIVTATSGAGKKILDIMKVKPGCVITDVARPLDLSAEDVALRPDVLVIESGEIELPGENVRMKNIGLPPRVAYACLAETIVLALEGRFENFTVGRNIEWEKVKEIYRLGLKHGMRLAAISGVNGVYSDEDILAVRERALAARAAMSQGGTTAGDLTAAAATPAVAITDRLVEGPAQA